MRKFVRGEFQICRTAARPVIDIGSMGKGVGADLAIHLDGVVAGMNAHMTEVHSKAWLQRTAASFALAKPGFDLLSRVKAAGQRSSGFALEPVVFFVVFRLFSLHHRSNR